MVMIHFTVSTTQSQHTGFKLYNKAALAAAIQRL